MPILVYFNPNEGVGCTQCGIYKRVARHIDGSGFDWEVPRTRGNPQTSAGGQQTVGGASGLEAAVGRAVARGRTAHTGARQRGREKRKSIGHELYEDDVSNVGSPPPSTAQPSVRFQAVRTF